MSTRQFKVDDLPALHVRRGKPKQLNGKRLTSTGRSRHRNLLSRSNGNSPKFAGLGVDSLQDFAVAPVLSQNVFNAFHGEYCALSQHRNSLIVGWQVRKWLASGAIRVACTAAHAVVLVAGFIFDLDFGS